MLWKNWDIFFYFFFSLFFSPNTKEMYLSSIFVQSIGLFIRRLIFLFVYIYIYMYIFDYSTAEKNCCISSILRWQYCDSLWCIVFVRTIVRCKLSTDGYLYVRQQRDHRNHEGCNKEVILHRTVECFCAGNTCFAYEW